MNNIEINPNKEYILAGDISMSMTTADPKCGGQTRYNYMLEKFKSFIKTAEDFDEHGSSTVILFGESVKVYEHIKFDDVNTKLNNIAFEGFTNLHLCIDKAYELHREERREKAKESKVHPGTNLFIFTDGEPTNRAAVKRSLINIANSIFKEDDFNITLLTVGTRSRELQAYLDDLHDELDKTGFDIIHIKELENTTFYNAGAGHK